MRTESYTCWSVVNALTSLLTQVRNSLNANTWPGGWGRHQGTLCEGCMRGLPPGGAPCYTPDHFAFFCRSEGLLFLPKARQWATWTEHGNEEQA